MKKQWLAVILILSAEYVSAQMVTDSTSVGIYGIRSWSRQGLLTRIGLLDSSDDLTETKRFATYYVDNYKNPRNRVTRIGFRSVRPGTTGAGANWNLLCKADISDRIDVSIASPGGGGY